MPFLNANYQKKKNIVEAKYVALRAGSPTPIIKYINQLICFFQVHMVTTWLDLSPVGEVLLDPSASTQTSTIDFKR